MLEIALNYHHKSYERLLQNIRMDHNKFRMFHKSDNLNKIKFKGIGKVQGLTANDHFTTLKPKVSEFSELLEQIYKQLNEIASIVEETDQNISSAIGRGL